ncbi:hypothetical protein OAF54_03235 [bacterium]|nr:hypothetical protein [bacterium]
MINLNTLNLEQTQAIHLIDNQYIGTNNYMGVVYFWHYDYRHYLRSASTHIKKLTHKALLKAGLDVGEASPEHEAIIKHYTRNVIM